MNIGSQLPMDPMMTTMAMDFGSKVIQQQQQQVQGMVDKYISVGQLKVSFILYSITTLLCSHAVNGYHVYLMLLNIAVTNDNSI